MTKLDYINNVLKACGLDDESLSRVTVSETNTSVTINLSTKTYFATPSLLKSILRSTSYSDDLLDTNNDSITLNLTRIPFGDDDLVNAFVTIVWLDNQTYQVSFVVTNFIKYTEDGIEYLA